MKIPNPISLLQDWWAAQQRAIDVQYLWPICKEQARDFAEARYVFAIHAICDPAWLRLPVEEIKRQIGELQ
jgi:hypothetical protein